LLSFCTTARRHRPATISAGLGACAVSNIGLAGVKGGGDGRGVGGGREGGATARPDVFASCVTNNVTLRVVPWAWVGCALAWTERASGVRRKP